MRVLIVGASGRTGALATAYALEKGYAVTALVRATSSMTPHPALTVSEGTPLNKADVEAAFKEPAEESIQAVIVALAASRASDSPFAKMLAPKWFIRDSVRDIRSQMRQHGVKRLIVMSAFGSGSSWSNFPLVFKLLFKASNMIHELRDHDAVDKELREASQDWNLDWTIARPTLLKGDQIEVREMGEVGQGVGMTDSCSRLGVAHWLIDAVESRSFDRSASVLVNA